MANNLVELKNGNLILFLHKHLPILQAKSKAEWNGLKKFLVLLDYAITNNQNPDTITFELTKERIREFGSNHYFNYYKESFFLESRFYFSDSANLKPKMYYLHTYLQNFIKESQAYLIKSLGIDEYFKPIKLDFSKPAVKQAFKVAFIKSKYVDENILKNISTWIARGATESIAPHHIAMRNTDYYEELSTSYVFEVVRKDLSKFYDLALSDKKIRSLKYDTDTEIYTFNVRKSPIYKARIVPKSMLSKMIHTKVEINKPELIKMLNISIANNNLNLSFYKIIFQEYADGNNYQVYTDIRNRLYSSFKENIIAFHSFTKETRNKLFKGFWQYDLTASAPTILMQLHERYYSSIELPSIRIYVEDRTLLRNKCADYLVKHTNADKDIAMKAVKEVFTSIFYGSKISKSQSTVSMSYEDRMLLMKNVEEFKSLVIEADLLFKNLTKYYEMQINNSGYIVIDGVEIINAMELNSNGELIKKKPSSLLSDVYVYYERQILNIVMNECKDILFIIHDGFITKKKIDYSNLQKIIFKKLNLIVNYEEEQL